MPDIKQSSAGTPITFLLVLSSDHITGATGLSPTVTISKNGAAYASPAGAVTELTNGWYKIAGNATDTNTLGPIDLHASVATADPCDMKDAANIVAYDPQDAVGLGLSRIDATVSSRMATFTLPTNFSSFSIDASGRVDLGKWIGVAPAAVTSSGYVQAALLRWKTDDVAGTPNALISGRVDSNAQVVGDKTGYSLSQAFPTNFSALAITVGGAVTVGTNNDKTGYTLSSAGIQAIFDFATSLLTTVGSIGKLLVDNIDAKISTRLPTSSYTAPLDAAGTRTAVGLASANLDTQFTNIPANLLDAANGVESGWTMRQLFRLWLAGICGPRASFGTAAPTVQNPASTKTRLTGAGIDANGNGTWSTDVT
jgi:hypothetical protein